MAREATVIIPTTKDRGPLLEYSVSSVQNQTVENIEIFIIGDGVNEETRNTIHGMMENDQRIKFFDHPKHKRRGEEYRHEAITEATGNVIFYLCDRDIMLPEYIENVLKKKEYYNFFLTTYYTINKDKSVIYSIIEEGYINRLIHKRNDFSKKNHFIIRSTGIRLSSMSHTLEFYKSLPYGWRTTPPEEKYTDIYMADQMINTENCKLLLNIKPPGFLYISRGKHPGWPVIKRFPELKFWYRLVSYKGIIGKLLLYPFLLKWIVLQCIRLIKGNIRIVWR